MKQIVSIVIGYLILLISAFANANDSIARVGAGGISLLKSEDIRMVREVLEISTKAIKVNYLFKNETNKDIQTVVAFPLPPYRWNSGESMTESNVRPLRSFTTQVGGKKVATTIARKAMAKNKDVTSQLREIGLSDSQIFETFAHCLDDGSENKFELCNVSSAQLGLLEQLGDWEIHETAFREQLFPANAEIDVLHEYAPLVGASYDIPYQKGFGYVSDMLVKSESSEACVDDRTRSAIQKRVNSLVEHGARNVWVTLKEVEYILGTGRNWKGAITNFTLILKKDSPEQFISLCFPGKPKRVGHSILKFTQENFIPQDKLIVYFYDVIADPEAIQ